MGGIAEQLLHHIVSVWNMRIPETGNASAETAFSPDTSCQLEKKNIFKFYCFLKFYLVAPSEKPKIILV